HTSAPKGGPNSIPPRADRRRQRERRERRTGGERGRLPGEAPAAGPFASLPERSSAAAGVERGPAPARPSAARHVPGCGPTSPAPEKAPNRASLPPPRRSRRERRRRLLRRPGIEDSTRWRQGHVSWRGRGRQGRRAWAGAPPLGLPPPPPPRRAGLGARELAAACIGRLLFRPGLSSSAVSRLPTLRRANARRARPPGRGPSPSRSKPAHLPSAGGDGAAGAVGAPPATSAHELPQCPVCTCSVFSPIHQNWVDGMGSGIITGVQDCTAGTMMMLSTRAQISEKVRT
ncbi:unnamed protein product, partial [Urochloa humidicola]